MLHRTCALLLLCLPLVLLSGCLGHEQKMIVKVEKFLEQDKYDQALTYLEGYLEKHSRVLSGWRYRVLIRLEQEDRALAATEYAALSAALERHEPEVLREVVLGAGGRWLLSDYRALARCAPEGVVDVAFFEDLLEAKHLGTGSLTKVAVSADEIAAVIDALPGSLPPAGSWAIVERYAADADPKLRRRVVRAAGRHLGTGGLTEQQTGQALEILRQGALADEDLREAAIIASLDLPPGPGRGDFIGTLVTTLAAAGDEQRAMALFLLGPDTQGPTWTVEQLGSWAETTEGVLRVLAVSGLQAQTANRERSRFLESKDGSGAAGERLAAVIGFAREGAPEAAAVWATIPAEERRTWASAVARTMAPDRGTWTKLALSDSDAVVAQQAARSMVLPGLGDDDAVAPALEAGMQVMDPATKAFTARAVVVRGATGLSLAVQGLFSQGQDRVMNEVLRGMVADGSDEWAPLVQLGLKADLPTIRELAVDAGVASCRAEDKELMKELLTDEDPHVAVRAASALYVLVGAGSDKK
ncbi:MAG: hypothetical protein GY898_16900 [Proteobacteria bacterium]|nr:hypothetical protein [Pseudomonadota bacterium]